MVVMSKKIGGYVAIAALAFVAGCVWSHRGDNANNNALFTAGEKWFLVDARQCEFQVAGWAPGRSGEDVASGFKDCVENLAKFDDIDH
jgi:hypothetical protein